MFIKLIEVIVVSLFLLTKGGAWIAFAIMTQSLPGELNASLLTQTTPLLNTLLTFPFSLAFLFFFAGFYQMAIWAQGKHRKYKKEFKDYPRVRKAIVPFLI